MRRFVIFALVFLLFAVGVIVSLKWAPGWFATKGLTNAKDRAEEAGRIRTACLAVLAGGLAAIGAYYTQAVNCGWCQMVSGGRGGRSGRTGVAAGSAATWPLPADEDPLRTETAGYPG